MRAEKLLRFFKQVFFSLCIIYFPILITLSFVIEVDDSWWGSEGVVLLKLLTFSLVSFPIFVSVIGVARFIFSIIEYKSRPIWETVTHGILLLPCLCCFASWIYIQKLMPVTVFTTALLLTAWSVLGIVKIIIMRRPPYWLSYLIRLIGCFWGKPSEAHIPKPTVLTPIFWLITVCLALLICIGGATIINLPNFDDSHGQSDFICSARLEKNSYEQGERGSVTTELLNRSDKTYSYSGSYSDYRPTIRLVHSETGAEITIDELPSTDDYGTYKIYSSEIRFTEFYFTVPHNAPLGEYDLHVFFKDYSNTLRGAMTVTAKK